MNYDCDTIAAKIEEALIETDWTPRDLSHDVAFHMTDWLDDLSTLQAFYASPETYTSSQIVDLLTRFLLHVPNHVAAAGKLLTGEPVADIFDVGATTSRSD